MFSCFGNKSSSQEDIPAKNTSSKKQNELKRSATVTNGSKRTVNERYVTSQTVVRTSAMHTSSELRRNIWSSSSVPSSSRTRIDAVPFRGAQPISPSSLVPISSRLQQLTSSNDVRVQTPSTRSANSPPSTKRIKPKKTEYKVKKTKKFYDNFRSGSLPVYQTHSENRGKALIVNNVKFYEEDLNRRGAKKDEKDLANVLGQIGFQVEKHSDVKEKDIRKILKQFTSDPKLKKVDICMVIIMSHGTNKGIPGGYTELLCVDGKRIATEDIIDYFNESECISLRNKPKIFIFQCCRSSPHERDGIPRSKKPQDKSNTLIAYSTIPGFPSNRHVENGTWYIQTICKVFSEHAHEYDIQELLTIVDNEMKKMESDSKQVSCYENRGFSRCYLHPR